MSRLRRVETERDLVIIDVLTLILILAITFFSITWLRIVLGLPFILFFPGYTLIAALFPRKEGLVFPGNMRESAPLPRNEGLGNIERLTLSVGLSIAVVPLIGLILNYTPWGINLYPILLSVSFFILAMSIVAWYKRRNYPLGDRFSVSFLYRQQLPALKWQKMGGWDKMLSITLVISILGVMGTLGYVVATPKVGEKFTEFYILGPEGEAANYPRELVVGKEGNVILGIVNHEQETTSYRVEAWIVKGDVEEQVNIWLDEKEQAEMEVELAQEEEWEAEIGFLLYEPGGFTTLSAPVTQGQVTLVVVGTNNFDVGDYIHIIGPDDEKTDEFVQIEDIDVSESEITIGSELEYDHNEGETVIEMQQIEFRLFKDGYSEPSQNVNLDITVIPA